MAASFELPIALTEAWSIDKAELIADTPSSLVFRVWRSGSTNIVKSLKPAGYGELPGLDFLEWRQGLGAVRLIDRVDHSSLLEDGGARTLREHLDRWGDEDATDVVLRVLGKLHASSGRTIPEALVPLDRHFKSLFLLAETSGSSELGTLASWAARIAHGLLSEQTAQRPLHGDLHHENIVQNASAEWRAIDPQGLFGDPVYDVANVFGNPLGNERLVLDRLRIIRLTESFAVHFGCSGRKVLSYAAVHAILSVAWMLEDGSTLSGNVRLAERFAFARIARSLLVEHYVD